MAGGQHTPCTPGDEVRQRLFAKMAGGQLQSLEPTGKPELELHEFMALLHGDELQHWVRESRHRWGKLRTIRGLLAYFADDYVEREGNASSAVLSGGVTVSGIFLAWSAQSGLGKTKSRKVERTRTWKSQDLTTQALNNAIGHRTEEDMAKIDRKTSVIGQALLDDEVDEAELLQHMKLTESFYESRVGSTERLLSWFVLLHAMAEPSSRLPFLRYDLGKTESRLRVASTPAPVPNHEDPCQSNLAESHSVDPFDEYGSEPEFMV